MATNRLDDEKVEEGVVNLVSLFQKRNEKAVRLLRNPEPVYLQIDFVKIPRMRRTITRIPLQNSLLTETSEVCLIVADVIRGRKVPHEITISHYTKLLQKRGVTDAQKLTILPSRQLRVEYSPYEARRKLCNMYDIFLIDNKISSFLFPKLGKQFFKSRKWPIPIRIKRKDLKDEILSKLKKTSLVIDGTGTTKTVQIGHLEMTSQEITENINSVAAYMAKYFPGGWNNIRSLHVKCQRTAAVPIYVSLIPPNEVPVPKIKRKRKNPVLAVDEVSILGRKVTVRRSGDVIVHDFSDDGDSEDAYETDEDSEIEEVDKSVNMKSHASVSKKRKQQDDEKEKEDEKDDDHSNQDEDEEAIDDDVETKYLFLMQKEEEQLSKEEAKNQSNANQSTKKESVDKKSKKNKNKDSTSNNSPKFKKRKMNGPDFKKIKRHEGLKKEIVRSR